MKIGLFGLFGCGNSGNDASLESMLVFLRRLGPEHEIICFCPRPEVVAETYKIASTFSSVGAFKTGPARCIDAILWHLPRRIKGVWHAIRSARAVDILIIPGTGFLDDFQDSPFGWPFLVFKWCTAAWFWRRKIFFVSIGAGPIRHPLSRLLMAAVARMAAYRSYRDEGSRQYVRSLGVNVSNDRVYPDIVFGLPRSLERSPLENPLVVGVGVMSYFGWLKAHVNGDNIYRAYLAKLNEFLTWLLERGHNIRLLTGDASDWAAVEDLKKYRLSSGATVPHEQNRIIAVRTFDLGGLMEQINETGAVVVTRYHNLVGALKLGRPAISLEYSSKNQALMTEMGLDEYCQHIESFDVALLKRQFSRMFDKRSDVRRRILKCEVDFRERLSAQEIVLADLLCVPMAAQDPQILVKDPL